MTNLEKQELFETMYKEELAEKAYFDDEENAKFLECDPESIPEDVYFEEVKEGEDVVKKFFKYELVENGDALLKMKLLKKSRFHSILICATFAASIVSVVCLIAMLIALL